VTTGACRCESCCTELAVRNRPGLSTISYRVDEFSGFRRALLRPLEGEDALHGWHPTPGDLGLQVLEWWAYLGDVLTFYNERIANEDYLRTAELSASVSGLVALLGYTPRPAIAAAGKVAAIRSRSRPAEPLVVPAGMQLASSATPGIPSQTFEAAAATFTGATDGPIVLPPSPGLVSPPRPGESGFGSVLLRGSVAGVAAGDDVLIVPRDVETAKENWTELTVLSVSKESDPNGGSDTRVLLSTEYDWWAAYAQAADARLVKTTRSAQSWTPRGSGDPVLQLDGANLKIRLASIERALPLGEVAFLDFGADGLVPVVPTATQEEFLGVPYPGASGSPPSPPNIPLLHTVVTAETPYAAWLAAFSPAGLRFGLRDVGAPVGAPATTLASLPVTVGNPSGLAVAAGGAEAFVEDANGNGIAVLATTASDGEITLLAGDDTAATFSLAAPLRLDLAVVDVTRGATVAGEQLGTGDASVGGQTFALKKSPLTYLAQGAAWKSTLSVAVDSLYWTEVASFYAQPPDAKVFVVSQRPDGKSEVRFGDGTNGARLPTGGKVVATYRYGAGAASPPAGRLTTILKPQPNLASVHDPVAVWGGADAQQPEDVRTNAPASVLTFGRAISADDYEAVAGLAPGVSRVRTYWTWDAGRQRALVKVYVGDDASAATSARAALAGAEDPNRPVLVVQATPIELAVACTIEVAPDHVADDVRDAATTSLADAFAPGLMGIGRPLYTSELESALSVPGVVAVHALSATAGGADVFSAEPVGFADPGEGSFYVLSSSSVTAVTANA
jgi:Baseplate J-like protein